MSDRSTYLGSTEIVALVEPEASPFCSPYSIWLEKTGLVEREEATERMGAGKYLERAILEEHNRRHGRNFVFNSEPRFWDSAKRIGATVDGIEGDEGAEVKTVRMDRMKDWDGGTPRYIWWQTQHEMLCSGLRRICVIPQFGFDRLRFEWIDVDPDAQERIIAACNVMWDRIDGKLPPPDADSHDATTKALKRRRVDAKVIELPRALRAVSDDLAAVKYKIKTLAKEARGMENEIRAALADATTGIWGDGHGWRVTTVNRKGYTVEPSSHTEMKRLTPKDAEDFGDTADE